MRRTTRPTLGHSALLGRLFGLAASVLLLTTAQPAAVSDGLVISQVYGGGGNAGAPFTHDFVEIHNRAAGPMPLSGLSLQYASATGTGNLGANAGQSATLPNIRVAPGGYVLVQLAGGAAGVPLPTPDYVDADSPINMSATGGKVALITGTATLGCNGASTPCTATQLARVIDLVGFGAATFSETAPTGAPSNTMAVIRREGNADTDDNAADFVVAAPAPRSGGTVPNDDVPLTPISGLQGTGDTSPFAAADVSTRGIVTARKTNGFFIQTPDAERDADPQTSEALFVFTGTFPAVTVGDEVDVAGRLVEFRGASAATPGTLTEITGPSVSVLSSGNSLPTAVDVATLLSAPTAVSSRSEQLERYEGMLVTTASMDVVGPTNTFGEIVAVLSGSARPFREPGVDVSEALPIEAPPTVPRFDGNFERLLLDSDDLVDAAGVRRPRLNLPAGTLAAPVRVQDVFGPLDYAFDAYRIALDSTAIGVGDRAPEPVPAVDGAEFTIASLNLENFRDGTPNLEARTQKAARLIAEILHAPDVLGLIEVGDLGDLQALAALVNTATGASYQAYLEDGDGQATAFEQNVGYLVNDARVVVFGVHQEFQGNTFEFGGQTDLLHDRPPLVLEAEVRHTGTPITVILNHLRSLIDVNSPAPFAASGLTVGARVREKRRLQAEDLADLITARAHENLVVLGDMNAFEVNDGLVDVVGTVAGTPVSADQVTESSTDRWPHELLNLATLLPPAERYSYVFEGNAQILDHVLVSPAMQPRVRRFVHARSNADFPESFETNFEVTTRLSDHDAAVAYFGPITDLSVMAVVSPSVLSGSDAAVQVTATSAGDSAADVTMTVALPPGLAWRTTTAPEGWTCATTGSSVTCATPNLPGGVSAVFEVLALVDCATTNATVLTIPVTVSSSTSDTTVGNDAASATVAVSNPAPVIEGAGTSVSLLGALPPSRPLVPVTVTYGVADNCGPVITRVKVTSDEPVTGVGQGAAGSTAPDWRVVDAHHVLLRAERSARGDGRVYTITISATDTAGNETAEAVHVVVPR